MRNTFGGSDAAWFTDFSGRNLIKPPSIVMATFWSGPPEDLSRVQYTDLRSLDDATTVISTVAARPDGTIPEFYGPDDSSVTRMWVSGDGGTTGLWTSMHGFSQVAATGDYMHLGNRPTIPSTKADVGLGNVDNTSDAAKPVSDATQTALNAKANASSLAAKADASRVQTLEDLTNTGRLSSATQAATFAGRKRALAADILRQMPREADVFTLSTETPTVSVVASGIGPSATSGITNAVFYAPARTAPGAVTVDVANDPHFYWAGAVPGKIHYGTSYPAQYYAVPEWLTGGGTPGSSAGFAAWLPRPRFFYTGQVFEAAFLAQGSGSQFYRLTIDGKRVTEKMTSAGTGLTGGNGYVLRVDLGTAKPRVIELELAGANTNVGSPMSFAGLFVEPTATLSRAPEPRFKFLSFSDSVLRGDNNGVKSYDSAVSRIATLLGSDEWVNQGIGGTGFLNPGANAGTYGNAQYKNRISPDVSPVGAQVILWCGVFNDITNYTPSQIQTQATADMAQMISENPNAIIIIGGCYCDSGVVTAQQAAGNAAIKAAAQANGLPFVDLLDYSGNGATAPAWAANTPYKCGDVVTNGNTVWTCTKDHTSGTTFSGTQPNWVSNVWANNATVGTLVSSVHPTAAGMDYLTRWWKAAIVKALRSIADAP